MLRPVLFAAAVVALVAPVRAADPDISGNWLLTYSQRGGMDQALAIIKVEMKDGKPIASTVYTPFKGLQLAVTGFEVGNGKTIKFNTSVGWSFEGTLEADGKTAVGNLGVDVAPNRGKLTRTDKTELTQAEAIIRTEPPTPVAETQKLVIAAASLRNQAIREKDADKKKELTEKADAAQKELDEKQPSLLREVTAKHADTPFGLDAAADLLRGAGKFKVTPCRGRATLSLWLKKGNDPIWPKIHTRDNRPNTGCSCTPKGDGDGCRGRCRTNEQGIHRQRLTRLSVADTECLQDRARIVVGAE